MSTSTPLPPAPFAGLVNALCSSPTSAHISQLSAASYHVSLPPEALSPSAPSAPSAVSAHAAAAQDLFVAVLNRFLVFSDLSLHLSASAPAPLHVHPQALAVARLGPQGALAALASYDGVFVSRLIGRCATTPAPLHGSAGYPCIAVDVAPHGAVAAASMAGQVALWPDTAAQTAVIIEIPEGLESCDRITQVSFVDAGVVVAWWSGLLVRYALRDGDVSLVWKMTDPKRGVTDFCLFSGTFFALGDGPNLGRAIMTRGDQLIYFVDLATGNNVQRKVHSSTGPVFVKGICVSAEGTFLWIRDARKLLRVDWPDRINNTDSATSSAKPRSATDQSSKVKSRPTPSKAVTEKSPKT